MGGRRLCPRDAAKKVLDQYLNEFMSTRIGVRRESSIVSATERMAGASPPLFVSICLSFFFSFSPL